MSEDYYQRLIALGLEAVAEKVSPSVLDVGCGPGRLIADIARRMPSAQCTGIDSAASMVDLARQILLLPAGTPIPVDASDYGFPVGSICAYGLTNVKVSQVSLGNHVIAGERYDLILASHLLDRVPSPSAALRQLLMLVASGGSILVSCAFNFVSRKQWAGPRSGAEVSELLRQNDFEVNYFDEDYPYRELQDARGTWTEHRVAIIMASRNCHPA